MASSHVSKFGESDEDNISYSTYFENVTGKDKAGMTKHSNDRNDNPDPLAAGSADKQLGDGPSRQIASDESGPLDHLQKSSAARSSHGRSMTSGSGSETENNSDQSKHLSCSCERKARTGSSLFSSDSGRSNKFAGDKHRRAPSIPKFGDWDENDPTSCENLSSIFESVKEEKKSPSFPSSRPQSSQGKRGVPSWFSKMGVCLYSERNR